MIYYDTVQSLGEKGKHRNIKEKGVESVLSSVSSRPVRQFGTGKRITKQWVGKKYLKHHYF